MPAIYAHYRFGKQLLPTLPPDVRQCIQRFRRMYDAGLHGPDLFFYYNPWMKTNIGALGREYHHKTGQAMFAHACTQATSEAARAYLYGLLAHYCLDSACHPFVNQMVTIGEAGHVALESEFDRHLMAADGSAQPHHQDNTRHLKLTRGECMTVAGFYPPATGAHISQSLKFMVFCCKFLSGPNRERREAITKKLTPAYLDQFVPTAQVEEYAFMVGELQTLYDQAMADYPILLQQLEAYRTTGEPLGEAFARNFC